MNGSAIVEKPSFKMLGLHFYSMTNFIESAYIISISKTASKKIGALIRSEVSFLELHRYQPTIRPCMEYCCYVWDGAPCCSLGILDKLKNEDTGLAVLHLMLLSNPWLIVQNKTTPSLFYWYYFGI